MAFGLDDFLGNLGSAAISNAFASDSREDTQAFNAEQAAISRAFTREQMQNKYQWQVKDLEAAGLNPMLAYGQQPSMGQSAAASSGNQATHDVQPYTVAKMTASQVAVNEAQERRLAADTDKAKAEADEIRARTPTHAVSMDQMRQNIEESKQRIEELMSRINVQHYSAANIAQQTVNLQETIPQIRATVDQLKSIAALNIQHITQSQAQVKALGAQTTRDYAQAGQLRALEGLTNEQKAEVVQRVQQNLPKIEAAVNTLEMYKRRLEMPGLEQQAASHESFRGALREALESLRGLVPFIGVMPTYTPTKPTEDRKWPRK